MLRNLNMYLFSLSINNHINQMEYDTPSDGERDKDHLRLT